jgi:hypothetical protein
VGDSEWIGEAGRDKGMETRVGDEAENMISEKNKWLRARRVRTLTLRPIIHQLFKIDANGNCNCKKTARTWEKVLVVFVVAAAVLERKERLGECGIRASVYIERFGIQTEVISALAVSQ